MNIHIVVNGKSHEVAEGLTVAKLVASLGLDQGPVAVEVNREVVPRAQHASHVIKNNDAVEIVHFVGGG